MKTKTDYLESKEFYDLMQCYRIADMMDQENVIKRFEAVKDYIREKSATPELLEALYNAEMALETQLEIYEKDRTVWAYGLTTLNKIKEVIKKATL